MKAQDLKNSILQLAIQGKLVSQDANDEPAEVLYAKIQAEKQKLIKEGKIKKDKPLPPITDDEIPFDIPPSWKWVRLGDIGDYKKGPFGSSLTKDIFSDIGATMSIWDKTQPHNILSHKDACFSPHEEQDIEEARTICHQLDIPYHIIDCTKQYRQQVLSYFKKEYISGHTPNPCIRCNAGIKFTALPQSARAAGINFDKFATGHYARLSFNPQNQRYCLQRAVDTTKDQTYFIYRLRQEQLAQILLPLGEYHKNEVRNIARRYNLKVSEKPDSQDFYSGNINDILQIPPRTGNFIDQNGKILGKHTGIWNFTIGQRRGLGISAERPLYVTALNPKTNEVVLGYEEECYSHSLIADNLNWVSVSELKQTSDILVKFRSAQQPFPAEFIPQENGKAQIIFPKKQKAAACGQSVVFYNSTGFVLGGGIICTVL